jgi:hypothetical protein
MQDVDLFLALAEIAGVFVGFGALIALRSGATADPAEVAFVGMVVWMGVQAVAGALAPVAISRFGVTGHALWLSCSIIVLALFWIGDEGVKRLSPERRAILAAMPRKVRARQELAGVPFWLPMTIALALVVLGVLPDHEEALYFAALVILLLFTAAAVLLMVITGAAAWKAPVNDGSGGPR